jgi:hypothetical protein
MYCILICVRIFVNFLIFSKILEMEHWTNKEMRGRKIYWLGEEAANRPAHLTAPTLPPVTGAAHRHLTI